MPAVAYYIDVSPPQSKGGEKPTLVSGDNDLLGLFLRVSLAILELGRCTIKTMYPLSSPDIPCNLIFIPLLTALRHVVLEKGRGE